MSCQCADPIEEQLNIWTGMGGGNSGCCGDEGHDSGFHRPANEIPAHDYSRRRDPFGRPVNDNWACAGDFSHRNHPVLRQKHAVLLARLMRGELPMICEFIGQPWADKPVYYWARWNGNNTLKKYTGSGHTHWSHISWYRSKANQRASLWVPSVSPVPNKPSGLIVDGQLGPKTIKRWQQVLGLRWQDGVISRPKSELVKAVQRILNNRLNAHLIVDGDGIRQDGRKYKTTAALQQYLGTPKDGRLSQPKSMAVQELQRRLNKGTF